MLLVYLPCIFRREFSRQTGVWASDTEGEPHWQLSSSTFPEGTWCQAALQTTCRIRNRFCHWEVEVAKPGAIKLSYVLCISPLKNLRSASYLWQQRERKTSLNCWIVNSCLTQTRHKNGCLVKVHLFDDSFWAGAASWSVHRAARDTCDICAEAQGNGWTDCEEGQHHFCVYFIEGIKITKIELKRKRKKWKNKKKNGDELNRS